VRPSPLFFSLLFALPLVGCTYQRLPPPEPPARDLPPQEEALPTESSGLSRIIITTDVPARVERYTHGYRPFMRVPLCSQTPCTVSLPYGEYELFFEGLTEKTRLSTAHVRIQRATTIVNHALGQTRHDPARGLGAFVVAGGIIALAAAAALAAHANKMGDPRPPEVTQLVAGGVGAIVIGGIVIGVSPTKVQEGATTQWTPPTAFNGASVTAGATF
jgi:hypothetical protein